jgi:hypothetical protein
MFKDDTYLESVMQRYKLGLDRLQAQQFQLPVPIRPGWRDRFLFSLGKILILLGSRLQKRSSIYTTTSYHPVYRVG